MAGSIREQASQELQPDILVDKLISILPGGSNAMLIYKIQKITSSQFVFNLLSRYKLMCYRLCYSFTLAVYDIAVKFQFVAAVVVACCTLLFYTFLSFRLYATNKSRLLGDL